MFFIKVVLLTCLFLVFPKITLAFDCENRNDACPKDGYPTCEITGQCAPPNCLVGMALIGGSWKLYCARTAPLASSTPFPNTPTSTLGKPCCLSELAGIRWLYNPSTNLCENTAGAKRAVSCETQKEKCNPGPPDMRGTCILKDPTAPTPPGITCGNSNQPCCPGRSAIEKRTCTNGNVPNDPFSEKCFCLVPTPRTGGYYVSAGCPLPGGKSGTNTAIGCIPSDNLNEFAGWILSKVVFIASGIAFLLMAFGAFQVITSAGDPKKTQAGKEVITSGLSGLLFIILSIFLLKLIGVDILKIPGFG